MHVDLNRDSSGMLFLPHFDIAGQKPSFGKQSRLQLNRINVTNSSIQYKDRSIPLDGSLKNLIIDVHNQGENIYRFQLSSDSITANYNDIPLTGDIMALSGSWCVDSLCLDSMRTNLSGQIITGMAKLIHSAPMNSLRGQFHILANPGLLPDTLFSHLPKHLRPMDGEANIAIRLGGSLDRPVIQTGIGIPLLKAGSNEIDDCFIQIGWQPGIFTLNNFQARLLGGQITGQGEFVSGMNQLNNVRFTATEMDLNQFMKMAGHTDAPYKGKVDAAVLVSTTEKSPMKWNINAEIEMRQINYHSQPVPDLKAQFQLRNGKAELSIDHQDATVFAESEFIDKKIDGHFDVRFPRLQIFSEAFDVPELRGSVSAQGIFGGTLKAPVIAADFSAEKILFQNFPLDTCSGSLQYKDNEANIQSSQFSGGLESLDSLQSLTHLKDLKGGLSYRGQVRGSLRNPEIDLSFVLNHPSFRTAKFDSGNGSLKLSDHQLHVSQFELVSDSLRLNISGGYSLSTAKGQLLVHLLRKPFQRDQSLLQLQSASNIYSVPLEHVHEGHSGVLKIDFNIADDSNIEIETTGEQIDLKSIAMLLCHPEDIAGQLQFHSEMSGSLSHPSARLQLSIHDLSYRESRIDSVLCLAGIKNACFTLKYLTLFKNKQFTRLNGNLCFTRTEEGKWAISRESTTQGSAKGSNTDLSLFNPFLPSGMRVSGLMNHNLKWKGNVRNPLFRGLINITGGELQLSTDAPSIQSISANIILKDTLFQMAPVSGIIQEVPFRFEGNIATRELKNSSINMHLYVSNQEALLIQGTLVSDSFHLSSKMDNLNLALFRPILPDLENLQGTVQARIDLQGPQTDPQLNGFVRLQNCAFKIPDSDLSFTRGKAWLTLHDRQIELDTLFFSAGQGFVSSNGTIVYSRKNIEDVHISTSMKAVKMKRPGEFMCTVDSALLQMEKQNSEYHVSGDIVLGETRLMKPIQPKTLLAIIEKKPKPVRSIPYFYSRIRLNIRLLESDKIWIDNNLARLRLHSELVLTGAMNQPGLSGRLSAKEGYVLYLDRKFKIEKGTLDFIDPNRINPILELSASSSIKGYQTQSRVPYTVWLKINGPLDEAIVELTSEPPLERSDIIALLTVGATRDQIMGKYESGKEMTLSSILRERASELSGQQISGYAARKVGGLLGLDEITIEGNLFRFGKTWGPQLLASKKLNNRIEISYTTTAGSSNEQNIRLDYKLSNHFSIEGETDQKGQSGIDLKYRLKFK